MRKYSVLNIPITETSLSKAAETVIEWSGDKTGRYVGVREVASVMAMHEDPYLLKVAQNANMNVPDGMPLVWLGKLKGYSVERACGPDLMDYVIREGQKFNIKHYLFGGKEGVAEKLIHNFTMKYPHAQFVGYNCPPFRKLTDDENEALISDINSSGAHVVWVGISSPKQDVWMSENVNKLDATLIGVGAAFDFHSGVVKRAPIWMQKSGLEWLHRLLSEPKRLWRRYLILAPKFIFKIAIRSK